METKSFPDFRWLEMIIGKNITSGKDCHTISCRKSSTVLQKCFTWIPNYNQISLSNKFLDKKCTERTFVIQSYKQVFLHCNSQSNRVTQKVARQIEKFLDWKAGIKTEHK